MAFDQSTISDVTAQRRGTDLLVTWSSSSPDGTTFQVYLNGRLVASTQALSATLPWPGEAAKIDVGAVDDGESGVIFSDDLPASPGGGGRVTLTITPDAWPDPDVAEFRIYGSAVPGGPVVTTAPIASIPPAETPTWTSGPLRPGLWSFEAKAVDLAGNESTAATASVAIAGPPGPPGIDANGDRLAYSFDPGTSTVTLTWLAPD